MILMTQQLNLASARTGSGTVVILWRSRLFERAFTLIEVLIAVTVFAIVLAALNGVYYGAFHLQVSATQAIEESIPAENAIKVMRKDLANVVLPGVLLAGEMNSGTSSGLSAQSFGNQDGTVYLELYNAGGHVDDYYPWGDIQKVDYLLQTSSSRGQGTGRNLVRAVYRNLLATSTETPDQQILLENVSKLQVTFFDGTNWLDTWGNTSSTNSTSSSTNSSTTSSLSSTNSSSSTNSVNIPAAIRIQIEIARDRNSKDMRLPIDLMVPIMVYPVSTNS